MTIFFGSNCNLCNSILSSSNSIFRIENAPRSAQYLPTMEEFNQSKTSVVIELYQCSDCGHYQLSGEPVDYWKEALTSAGISPEMREFRIEQLKSWVDKYNLYNKNVMEIGCGDGHLLDILSDAEVIASGLEFSTTQVKKGRMKGRNIYQGYPLDSSFSFSAILDGFLCINFLEHTPKPVDFLRSIFRACKPGAVGIVEVPNFQKDIDRQKSYNLIRDHISYFTFRTLALAIKLSGFDLLSIRDVWHSDDIEAIVQVPYPSPCIQWQSKTPIVQGLESFFASEQGKIAIWGASHQALTLLGMIKPQNVICIADSAPFKQGKVDPVCGIPIVSPNEMISIQPDLVIIIAAGYSNEIKKMLKSNKDYLGRIMVLEDIDTQ